jgi:hypothetical protein
MALARKATVHCRTVSMDWDVLYHAVMALSRLRGDGSRFLNKETGKPRQIGASKMWNIGILNEIRGNIWANGEEKSRQIFDCMNKARAFECRDDEDRVFAMLGIFNRGRENPFKAEYGKTVANIYEEFAQYCLQYGSTVGILSWAGEVNLSSMEDRLEVPSWVPDWRLPYRPLLKSQIYE